MNNWWKKIAEFELERFSFLGRNISGQKPKPSPFILMGKHSWTCTRATPKCQSGLVVYWTLFLMEYHTKWWVGVLSLHPPLPGSNLQEWIMRPKYHETCCEYKNLSALSCLAHFFQMTELAIKLDCVNLGFVVHLLKFSQGIISFASLYAHTARLGCNHVCPCMHEYSNYERSTMKTMKDPPRKLAEIILAPKY